VQLTIHLNRHFDIISKVVSSLSEALIAAPRTVAADRGGVESMARPPRTLQIGTRPRRVPSGYRALAVVAAALALASCGGDDGDGSAGSSEPPPQGGANPSPGGTNQAPTIGGTPPSQVMAGSAYDFTPTANDADGDILTFSISSRPAWADFDSATGRLSGTPAESDVGTYSQISISVSDGEATRNLSAFSIAVVTTASGSATLSWTAPSEKTDGTPVDLSGYKIYWGTSSRSYSNSATLNSPGFSSYVVDELTPATWYFAVTAVDGQGLESDYSNEATKQIL
jgi:hypothetical protein